MKRVKESEVRRVGLGREGCWDLLTCLSKCRSKTSAHSFLLRSLAMSRAVFPSWEINERGEKSNGGSDFVSQGRVRHPLQEKRGGGSATIGTSQDQRSAAILQRENSRDGNQKRGEERGIGYMILKIHIRPPLQEKRGGGSVTIVTSQDKSSVAILQREN
jgi:hypothetical protein